MIELLISEKYDYRQAMVWISKILLWLNGVLEDREDISMEGYMVARDQPKHVIVLLLVEEKYHKQFIDVLFQPPEELKDKYIASVPIEEPCPVTEVKSEEGEEKKDEEEKKKEEKG